MYRLWETVLNFYPHLENKETYGVETMKKIKVMDKYLSAFEKISTAEICKVVNKVFGIDLETVSSNKMDTSIASQSRMTMDKYLEQCGNRITGEEISNMLNQILGINLHAIDALEQERISLYSKGQWVVQNDRDLFIVYTGIHDVDVKVFPTKYFTEQTGLDVLPSDLQHSLSRIGFHYDKKMQSYYFANPTGQAVSDQFKGQTIGAIVEVIHRLYSHL